MTKETTIETTAKPADDTTAITTIKTGVVPPEVSVDKDLQEKKITMITTGKDGGEMTEEKTTTIETAATTSREIEKIELKANSEEDIGTSRETTAITSRETEKIGVKASSEEDSGTSREIAETANGEGEEKTTTIETTIEETTAKPADDTTAITRIISDAVSSEVSVDKDLQEKKTTIITTGKPGDDTTAKTTIETTMKLLKLIKGNPLISLTELGELMHLTKDGIRYHLKKLKAEGMIKRIGSSRAGYWKITE